MTEVEERVFYSTGLSYTLKWVTDRHKKILPLQLSDKLLNYYNFLCSNQYPDELFKDTSITRCSSFTIKNLRKHGRKNISLKLVKFGAVQLVNEKNRPEMFSEDILNIPKMASIWHEIFSNTIDGPVGHDPVLGKILEINNCVLSTEISVWSTTLEAISSGRLTRSTFECEARDLFTGHIDLLLYDTKSKQFIVADYKPENAFLKSLPQIAIYGMMIKKILGVERLKCMSFSRGKAWIYDPDILKNEIPHYLRQYGNPKLHWQWVLTGM